MKMYDAQGNLMIGGAPPRPINPFPNITGGVPQTTRYDRAIRNLGPPTPVTDVSDFPNGAITLNVTLALADVLAITMSVQPRRMLCMQNHETSPAGSFLYVNFGSAASQFSRWFSIPVGGVILLDSVVPQDDVHIAGSITGVLAVLAYTTFPVTQFQTQAPA